jgi:hypothetical protein
MIRIVKSIVEKFVRTVRKENTIFVVSVKLIIKKKNVVAKDIVAKDVVKLLKEKMCS